jgi:hypothetical protein
LARILVISFATCGNERDDDREDAAEVEEEVLDRGRPLQRDHACAEADEPGDEERLGRRVVVGADGPKEVPSLTPALVEHRRR